VHLRTIYDRTELIGHTVHTVAENLLLGAALVIAILVIFLGNWRAALIVAAVIPLSLLFAFIMLDARGVPANLISLGAVDFGIIIDSAVVMVEALLVRLALLGEPGRHDSALRERTLKQTVVELGHADHVSKAIIIVAFLPIFTFQRVEGKIFTPVAFTLSFACWAPHPDHHPGADPALGRAPPSDGRKAQPLAAPPAGRLPAACWRRRAPRIFVMLASVLALVVTLAWRPCWAVSSCPSSTRATSGSPSACRPRFAGKDRAVEQQVRAILSYPEVKAMSSRTWAGPTTAPTQGPQQHRNPGRPEAARQLALCGQGRAGGQHVGEDPQPCPACRPTSRR
jgi:cobalt-zinc-cadmium resistance protein CzcA